MYCIFDFLCAGARLLLVGWRSAAALHLLHDIYIYMRILLIRRHESTIYSTRIQYVISSIYILRRLVPTACGLALGCRTLGSGSGFTVTPVLHHIHMRPVLPIRMQH